MKVAKLLGDEKQVPSGVFQVVDDLITDLARDKGLDQVDQRLKEIGLPEFFSNGTNVDTVREGLLNLRLTFRSPEWFFSLGVGTLVSSLRFGSAETILGATKRDSSLRSENDSMSVRAFGGLVKKYFAGVQMPLLVMLHNCSVGLLEVFFELREVARNVIAANTTIGGHMSPRLWLRDGGSMSEDHEWCQNVLKLERKGNSFRRFVGIGNDPKAWESLVERMVDVVDQLGNGRACDEWTSLRTSCPVPGSNVDSLVVMDDLMAVMRRLRPCVDDSGFDKIVSRLLLARTAPNEIWPAIYFPTCGLHPHKYYSNPKEAGEGNGFEFLDRVRWGELLRK